MGSLSFVVQQNMVVVFFFYGLAFFIFGAGVFFLSDKKGEYSFSHCLWLLALFGVLHGINEWFDMAMILGKADWLPNTYSLIKFIRGYFALISFICLLGFGIEAFIIDSSRRAKINWALGSIAMILVVIEYLVFVLHADHKTFFTFSDILTRYFIGLPGALLTGIAFLWWMRRMQSVFVRLGFFVVGICFLCYAFLSGIIVPQANFFPASVLNYPNFLKIVGLPVQMLRTFCAIGTAVFIFFALKAFNASKIRKLTIKAEKDSLTQLQNRSSFNEIILKECSRVERYHRELSILFLDVDDFKKYNDTYGHMKGDEVLLTLARTLLGQIRLPDYTFRYGGEEFIILLPETELSDAVSLAKRAKDAFSEIEFKPRGQKIVRKTISIGAAKYDPDMLPLDFVDIADKAMYQAKRHGKNKICFYDNENYYLYPMLPVKEKGAESEE